MRYMSLVKLPPFQKIIWLMPAAYALHIVEEYAGNFPAWVTNVVGGTFSYLGFDLNNLAFMVVLLVLVAINSRHPTRLRTFALVVFASANLFWDFLFHLYNLRLRPVLTGSPHGYVAVLSHSDFGGDCGPA